MSESRTIVVGGGIVGICAAYFLARRGQCVALIEKGSGDDSASTGNAGLISLGHGPIPRPGLTARAIRWMLQPTSPLYIPPRLDPQLLLWFLGFHRACGRDHHKRSMDILAEHGWPAGECFRRLVEEESLECEYRPVGQLDVFRTETGLRNGEQEASLMRSYGYNTEVINGDELRRREPAFQSDVAGAVLAHDRAFANPGEFIVKMIERAEKHGAEVLRDTEVTELLVDDGRCVGVRTKEDDRIEADTVVLAAGIWSTQLARRVGVSIPMQPAKGYHVNLTAPEPCLTTASVLADVFVAATPMAGGLRLAGTLELSGINDRLVTKRLDMLCIGARKYLRGIDETQILSQWCGMRPCTADGLPIIGWAGNLGNLFIATGHAMMGFALGPLAGRIASECILDGESSTDISPLSPSRFT